MPMPRTIRAPLPRYRARLVMTADRPDLSRGSRVLASLASLSARIAQVLESPGSLATVEKDSRGMAYMNEARSPPRATLLRQAAMLGHGGAQKLLGQLGYGDAFPPVGNTEYEMRPARKDLRPGKVRDCGFLAS